MSSSNRLKTCCTCKKPKTEDQFSQTEWSNLSGRCRVCIQTKNHKTAEKTKVVRSAKQKEYYERNKEHLKRKMRERYTQNRTVQLEKNRQWWADNKDIVNANRSANKDELTYRSWVYNLRRRYGITPADYDRMLADQGSVCAICSTSDPGPVGRAGKIGRVFAVDHCHITGKVRGLLCHRCNRGLGMFSDKIDTLSNAIQYLEKSKID